jgi:hypothetical protein
VNRGRASVGALLCVALTMSCASPSESVRGTWVAPSTAPTVSPGPTATEAPPRVIPPKAGLPVVDYWPSPRGLPKDPDPMSLVRPAEGLHPTGQLGLYDRPGGTAKVMLAPTIRGVPLTLPIVDRKWGWVAVLVPSVNRTVAWVPPGGWRTVALRDQIVVIRSTHELRWYRDDQLVRSWRVTLGARATPTPLGRTFILGTSLLNGDVYADTKVFALGSVPDDVDAIPPGLRGAHIGIHTWYHDNDLGRNTSDGCIRLTKRGQRLLLDELVPGTSVVVVDRLEA